jgi:type I restriction-modification system methyltransferase subunit
MDSIMQIESITIRTKRMIDDLKTICANFGLGGSPGEYKIITQVFLYKYLSDKFLYEAKKADPSLAKADHIEEALSAMSDDQYEMLLMMLGGDTAKLKKTHYISYLFNHQNDDTMRKQDGSPYPFHELFDDTLVDIANFNLDIFSVQTGGEEKIRLFEPISQYVIESAKKPLFCRAIINKLVEFSFAEVFEQKYDFFAQIFEYLIKDYNKDFGKYAEYYTPHTIAAIIARIMVQGDVSNVTVYDPAAGSGTLVLALAHQIGEENCAIYTQDISAKSNEFLRLNLILNNLVHSLGNVVHDDTLIAPRHLNTQKNGLAQFDYIVSNPPFNMDFSDNRDTLAGEKHKERFFAGVPNIPNKDKDKMAVYLMFIQHIIYSMKEHGKAAIVVPTGFLTAGSGIPKKIREHIVKNRMLRGVVSMPSNIFATTGTNVSILFLDKDNKDGKVILMDASKLGTKEKVDGKNQRTVLSEEEIDRIIDTFNTGKAEDDFCVAVSYSDIEQKKFSFSAGQYFEVKIEYVELTQEEFAEKMNGFTSRLDELFAESRRLEDEIKKQLGRVKYE